MRAEMDRAGAEGAALLVVCSLLLKTLRSLLMARVCCPLIARIQLLSGDLEAMRAEPWSRCRRKTVFVHVRSVQPALGLDVHAAQTDG